MFAQYFTQTPEETIALGSRLAERLKGGDCVLLYGDLGAGKTHFTKGVAMGLGVMMTIKSPTYAYVNKYSIPNRGAAPRGANSGECSPSKTLYHYDLYRLNEGDDFASIGLEESLLEPEAIHVVEWADRLGEKLPHRYIFVGIEVHGAYRDIKIEFFSPTILSETPIASYYEEWATPLHVREHTRLVTHVATEIARAYLNNGEILNANLLYGACMLHDMARVCDFRTLEKDKFAEPVTTAIWQKWLRLREQYRGLHHGDIAWRQLKERGYTETAELIRLHKSINLVLEPSAYDTLEKQIIYYADKRVKHAEIVDLEERFRDGRARYGDMDSPEEKRLFEEVELMTIELEKRLFENLDIKPGDIKA